MWQAFIANAGSDLGKKLPLNQKIALLNRSVHTIAAYRHSRWPPQAQVGKEIDALQTRMAVTMIKTPREEFEDIDVFCRRRSRIARNFCKDCGLWSLSWFRKAQNWDAHLSRHDDLLATRFRNYRDEKWLEARRAMYAVSNSLNPRPWTTTAGRTATRVYAGSIAMRWQSGIHYADVHCGEG